MLFPEFSTSPSESYLGQEKNASTRLTWNGCRLFDLIGESATHESNVSLDCDISESNKNKFNSFFMVSSCFIQIISKIRRFGLNRTQREIEVAYLCLSFDILDLESWWEGKTKLISLFSIIYNQRVKVLWASNLEKNNKYHMFGKNKTLNLVFSLFFLILTEEASFRRAMKRNSLISWICLGIFISGF